MFDFSFKKANEVLFNVLILQNLVGIILQSAHVLWKNMFRFVYFKLIICSDAL